MSSLLDFRRINWGNLKFIHTQKKNFVNFVLRRLPQFIYKLSIKNICKINFFSTIYLQKKIPNLIFLSHSLPLSLRQFIFFSRFSFASRSYTLSTPNLLSTKDRSNFDNSPPIFYFPSIQIYQSNTKKLRRIKLISTHYHSPYPHTSFPQNNHTYTTSWA